VIFYFIDTGFAAPLSSLPAALTELLAEPVRLQEVEDRKVIAYMQSSCRYIDRWSLIKRLFTK
jgi:hypothetical protein